MERKIGERFDFKGEILEVVEQGGCEGCYLFTMRCVKSRHIRGECSSYRLDGKSVIFKSRWHTQPPNQSPELVRGIESDMDEIEEYLKQNEKRLTYGIVMCSACGEELKPWELPKDLDSIEIDEIECIACEMKARDSEDLDAGFM